MVDTNMNTSSASPLHESLQINCSKENTIFIPDNVSSLSDHLFTETDRIMITVLLPIVVTVGVLGNAAFLFMVKRLDRMHTLANMCLENIAVADIILLISGPPVYVWSYFASPIRNNMPILHGGCFATFLISQIGYYASFGLITVISLERWLAICRPLQHRRMAHKSRMVKSIASAWIIGSAIAVLNTLRYGKGQWMCMKWPESESFQLTLPKYLHTCVSMGTYFDIYPEIVELLTFAIGFSVNGVFYIKIIKKLSNRLSTASSTGDSQTIKVRNQVARLSIINGVVFFICHTPLVISNLHGILQSIFSVNLLSKSQYESGTIAGHAFRYVNSCVHVFVYAFSSTFYRDGFREVFDFCGLLRRKSTTPRIIKAADTCMIATRM